MTEVEHSVKTHLFRVTAKPEVTEADLTAAIRAVKFRARIVRVME